MEGIKDWVALLDEDEDDYLFWQHGFRSWATHLELHWFSSVHAFLSAAALGKSNPVALVIDGVVPRGEESKWLSTMLLHPSCEKACLIMLSAQLEEPQHQTYLNLGATDHLIKPVTVEELKSTVLRVSGHIADKR
ncbi:hypothetical protein [Spirosoma validum]|uniref:Response regulator n=1 Tax=Spirosoma validum TaxID=2771355 RepID=A0A927B6Y0_9BACT|nr:hypothetical protein [Spirosoma validum]MBD2756585.1 hypothetical protein [Spirosoma validum]